MKQKFGNKKMKKSASEWGDYRERGDSKRYKKSNQKESQKRNYQ